MQDIGMIKKHCYFSMNNGHKKYP